MAAGAAAAAAAAAAERMRQEEEEEMTGYRDDELKEGWEFKIVRAHTAAFSKPEVLRQVCDEEARAGWILLEKFDNNRIRFKRPASARHNPGVPGVDPYRTNYGISQGKLAALIVGGIFGILVLVALIVLLLRS